MNPFKPPGLCPFLKLFFIAAILIASLDASSPRFAKAQARAMLPMVGDVAPTESMSLDGIWTINTIDKKIRIESGRAYAVDSWLHLFVLKIEPGMVVINEINQTAPGEYSGKDLPLMGKWNAKFEADRSLSVTVAGAMGPVGYKLIPVQLDNDDWFYKEMMVAGLQPDPSRDQPPPIGIPGPPDNQPPPPVFEPDPPEVKPDPPVYDPPPPPVFKRRVVTGPCGREGALACGKKGKVDAIKVGDAKKWGCKGKQSYFTPHNGGECWRCPSGFKRTTTPIHKPNSCKARGLKLGKKKHVNAKFERAAFSCAKGQFKKGKYCYACPKGSKKIAILGVFNPVKSCKTIPYCEAGLSLTPMPPKPLMDLGPAIQRKCSKPFKPSKVLLPMAKHHMGLAKGISLSAGKFAFDVLKNKSLRKAIKNKNKRKISAEIKKMASFNNLKSKAQSKGYRAISIGVGSGVKVGMGLEKELGVALDWNGGIQFYGTSIISKGLALSAGGGISLGVWRVNKEQLSGYSHGVSTSVPTGGVVDMGGGAWFSYYPIEFLGLAYTAGMGVGAEVGVYNEALTEMYR